MGQKKKVGMIFPHKCQKAGWWILGATIVLYTAGIGFDAAGATFFANLNTGGIMMAAILPALLHLSILLICLSSESEEDEYVMHMRTRIVSWLACWWFVVTLLSGASTWTMVRIGTIDTVGRLQCVFTPMRSIYVLALVYIAWLKIWQWKLRKESLCNEK